MRQPLLAAVAIALVASPVRAQPAAASAVPPAAVATSSASDVAPSLARGFVNLERRRLSAAEQTFSTILSQPGLTPSERVRTLRGLGATLFERSRRVEAADTLGQALSAATAIGDRREQGWARRYLGALHYGDGRIADARALWSVAREDFVAAGDARGEFQALDDLALITRGLEQRPLVERCYQIAVAERDTLLEARARRRWGQALIEAARPGPALIELERAVVLLRPTDPVERGYLGDTLAILGWALRSHGAHARAVPVHREAIRLAEAAGDVNALVWNNHGLGIALAELQKYDQAEVALSRGLEAARRTGASTTVRLLTEATGWLAMMRGDWRRAARTLEAAQAMPGVEWTVTQYINLARAYRGLRRLDQAQDTANHAVALARKHGLVDNELRALTELAQLQEQRGDLDAAQQTLNDVVDRLETYRDQLAPQDFLKQGFGDRFSDAYGASVQLLMRRDRPAEALTAAERQRSRAFADLLATRRSREADEAETASGAWTLGGPSADPPASSVPIDSARSLSALDSAALVALARRLATTLVVYWIHERGSYAWVVRGDGTIQAVTLQTTPAALRRAVRRAADDVPDVAITRSSSSHATAVVGSRSAYRTLHQLLWAPIARWLPEDADPRITIVPHGPLFALPFGALLDARGRYVIEHYAVHYAASGAVLADAAEGARHDAGPDARELLVADPQPLPSPTTGVRLPPLTAARTEARTIASLIGPGADRLTGSRASEAAVRAALPGARLAHFATHALVTDDDPLGSHLMLAAADQGRATPDRDGRLTASEVAGLSLSADLVVLGACRSARGPVSSDGIAGLTRAFMAAGVPSVIATLWDVSDSPTARVMTRFYRSYLAGTSKDRALRAAQLALLRDLRAGRIVRAAGETTLTYAEHPHLWAGAILIGAP